MAAHRAIHLVRGAQDSVEIDPAHFVKDWLFEMVGMKHGRVVLERTYVAQLCFHSPDGVLREAKPITANLYPFLSTLMKRVVATSWDRISAKGASVIAVPKEDLVDVYDAFSDRWKIVGFESDHFIRKRLEGFKRTLNDELIRIGIPTKLFCHNSSVGYWLSVHPECLSLNALDDGL